MSLWILLGLDPWSSLVVDLALIFSLVFTVAMLVFYLWKYGEWIRVGKSKLLVWFLGRDLVARPVPAKVIAGQFLDLGRYGKVFIDPLAVYKTDTKTNTSICFVYAPYGATLRPEIVVTASKLKERGFETLEEAEKAAVESGENVKVEIKDPVVVRVQDIVGYFKYTIGPQTLSEAIAYKAAETISQFMGPTEMKLRSMGKLLIIVIAVIVALMLVSMFTGG